MDRNQSLPDNPAPVNGQLKELLVRLERELSGQAETIEARAAFIHEREQRLKLRRERLGQLTTTLKRDRKALVAMRASLNRQAEALHGEQAHQQDHAHELEQLRRQLAGARQAATDARARAECRQLELARQAKALEQRQTQMTRQQQALARERKSLQEQRDEWQAQRKRQEQALAEQQAACASHTLELEEQARELERIDAAIDLRRKKLHEDQQALKAERDAFQLAQADLIEQRGHLEERLETIHHRERDVIEREQALQQRVEQTERDLADQQEVLETERAAIKDERQTLEAQHVHVEALEHELNLKLEHVQQQQAEVEALQRQWDERLARASQSSTAVAPAEASELVRREAELTRKEKEFRRTLDKAMYDLVVERDRLRKAEKRTERLREALESRRAQLRRGRSLLRQRWQDYYTRTHGNGQSQAAAPGDRGEAAADVEAGGFYAENAGETDKSPKAIEAPSMESSAGGSSRDTRARGIWSAPAVWTAVLIGLLALGGASYAVGRVWIQSVYRATAELALVPPRTASSGVDLVEASLTQPVLTDTLDRLETRNLRPFENVTVMRAALRPDTGPGRFQRIGDDRYELTYQHTNPELAVLIVEAWSDALIHHLGTVFSDGGGSVEYLRRPAYDPAPLAYVEQRRWRLIATLFASSAAAFLLLLGMVAIIPGLRRS